MKKIYSKVFSYYLQYRLWDSNQDLQNQIARICQVKLEVLDVGRCEISIA